MTDQNHGAQGHAEEHGHEAHHGDDHVAGHEHDGHGHGEHWGDYNSQPEEPSSLPPIYPIWLAALGLSLAMLLGSIVASSFMLAEAREAHESEHESH